VLVLLPPPKRTHPQGGKHRIPRGIIALLPLLPLSFWCGALTQFHYHDRRSGRSGCCAV